MFRLSLLIIASIMLSNCDNERHTPEEVSEMVVLQRMVKEVSEELWMLGFLFDSEQVELEVRDPLDMASMFNHINNESRQEIKSSLSFGPAMTKEAKAEPLYNDGARSRLAFYDPNSKTIIFRRGARHELSKGYLAHELAHVYQDQNWGFSAIWRPYHDKPSRELFNVTQFIVEGHAELVRKAYEQKYAKNAAVARSVSTTVGRSAVNDCLACSETTLANLPYSLGMRFLAHQYQNGGWSMAESQLEKLPESTEQIIHPKKYRQDEPQDLSLPSFDNKDLKTELTLTGSLGEAFLLTKLLSLDVPTEQAFESASGWDGDIAHFYRSPDGKEALIWRLIFDRQIDAQQLEAVVKNVDEPHDFFRVGRVVDWIITENPQLKRQLRIFLSKHPAQPEKNAEDERSTLEQEATMKNERSLYENPSFQPKIVVGPKSKP